MRWRRLFETITGVRRGKLAEAMRKRLRRQYDHAERFIEDALATETDSRERIWLLNQQFRLRTSRTIRGI